MEGLSCVPTGVGITGMICEMTTDPGNAAEEFLRFGSIALAYALEVRPFPDWEIQTLLGFGYEEMEALRQEFLDGSAIGNNTARMVVAVWNNLLGYPHVDFSALEERFGLTRDEQRMLLRKLRDEVLSGLPR